MSGTLINLKAGNSSHLHSILINFYTIFFEWVSECLYIYIYKHTQYFKFKVETIKTG